MADNPAAIPSHSRRPLCNLLGWHKQLLKQGYVAPMPKSSLHKLYGRHHNLVDHYEISISQITFYVDVYFLYHCQYFYQTWLYTWVTRGCLIRNTNSLPFASTWVDSLFFCGVRVAHLFIFLCRVFVLFAFVLCPMLYVSCVQCCLCLFSSPLVFICDVRIVHFVQYASLRSYFRVLMSITISAWKQYSVRLTPTCL